MVVFFAGQDRYKNDIFNYHPYYKYEEFKDFSLSIYQKAEYIIFHEIDGLYCEIISSKYTLDRIKTIVEEVRETVCVEYLA